MTPDEFRSAWPYILEGRVEWGDMDAMGHVNNTHYFRYFERVRTEFLVETGFMRRMQGHGFGPILASTQCRFRLPLSYPDDILTATRVSAIQEDRLTMLYAVYSAQAQAIAAEGDGIVVCYDYAVAGKCPWPVEVREWLEQHLSANPH